MYIQEGHTSVSLFAAFERRGNDLKDCKDLYLKAKARIWP